MTKRNIHIIGKGAMGSSLEFALSEKNYEVVSFGRNEIQNFDKPLTGLVFICTDDSSISTVVDELILTRKNELSDLLVVHCSGAVSMAVLRPLHKLGANIGATHPIQTFVKGTFSSFQNVFVSIQTTTNVVYDEIAEIYVSLGAKPKKVSHDEKVALHIAAVFASNFIGSNLLASQEVLNMFNLPVQSREIFAPLILQAAQNIVDKELIDALSGPAKRQDYRTLMLHEKTISENKRLVNLYRLQTANILDFVHKP